MENIQKQNPTINPKNKRTTCISQIIQDKFANLFGGIIGTLNGTYTKNAVVELLWRQDSGKVFAIFSDFQEFKNAFQNELGLLLSPFKVGPKNISPTIIFTEENVRDWKNQYKESLEKPSTVFHSARNLPVSTNSKRNSRSPDIIDNSVTDDLIKENNEMKKCIIHLTTMYLKEQLKMRNNSNAEEVMNKLKQDIPFLCLNDTISATCLKSALESVSNNASAGYSKDQTKNICRKEIIKEWKSSVNHICAAFFKFYLKKNFKISVNRNETTSLYQIMEQIKNEKTLFSKKFNTSFLDNFLPVLEQILSRNTVGNTKYCNLIV